MFFTVHGNARTLNWWNYQYIVQFNLGQISVDDSTKSYKRDEKILVFSLNFLLLFQKIRSENRKSDQVSKLVHFDTHVCKSESKGLFHIKPKFVTFTIRESGPYQPYSLGMCIAKDKNFSGWI